MTLRRQLSLQLGLLVLVILSGAALLAGTLVTARFRAAADLALASDVRAVRTGIRNDWLRLTDQLALAADAPQVARTLARLSSGLVAANDPEVVDLATRLGGQHGLPFCQILDRRGTVLSNRHSPADFGHVNEALSGSWPTVPADGGHPPGVLPEPRWALVRDLNARHPALVAGLRLPVGDDAYDLVGGLLFAPDDLAARATSIGAAVGLSFAGQWFWGTPRVAAGGTQPRLEPAELAAFRPGAIGVIDREGERWRVLIETLPDLSVGQLDGDPSAPAAAGDAPPPPSQVLVAVTLSESPLGSALADLYRSMIIVAVIGIVTALLVAALLARRLTAPLEVTVRAAGKVAEGDLDTRVEAIGSVETRLLAASFNQMTAKLKADREQLIEAERLGAWRDVARRLAHEIGNALSPIQLSVDAVRRAHADRSDRLEETLASSTRIVREEIERLRRLVQEFSNFARAPAPRPAPTDVDRLVAEVIDLERRSAPEVELAGPDDDDAPAGEAELDADAVRGALINLIQNAAQATAAGGRVTVALSSTPETVTIAVTDDGSGIADEIRPQIFSPYVSHRQGGTGLGLAIVKRTAVEHGGRVEFDSVVGQGSSFRLILPRAWSGPSAAESRE